MTVDNVLVYQTQMTTLSSDSRAMSLEAPLLIRRVTLSDIAQYLRDPDNLDFRPKQNSPLIDAGYHINQSDVPWKKVPITRSETVVGKAPDIGAYEYGDTHYWIPGFKFPHASTPVPPSEAKTAKPDCDLMWLGGYKANKHKLYFADKESDLAFQKTFTGKDNIFTPGKLESGQTYYWRVDALRNGETITGDVWKFTIK